MENILEEIEIKKTIKSKSVDRIKEINKENWHWFSIVMMVVWFMPTIFILFPSEETPIMEYKYQIFCALIFLFFCICLATRMCKIHKEQIDALATKIDYLETKLKEYDR